MKWTLSPLLSSVTVQNKWHHWAVPLHDRGLQVGAAVAPFTVWHRNTTLALPVFLLALCLDSATHSCFLSSLPLTSALPAGPRPAVSLRLSLSKVSREARCSRRIICPLMSGGSQYLPELKIHPSCVRLHTCAEGSPWRAGGSLQPDYWWRKNKLEPSLSSLGKQHTPQCASVAVMLMAHLESSLIGFLFQITPSSGLIFEDF